MFRAAREFGWSAVRSRPMDYVELQASLAWLDEQRERPSTTEAYLMQIAAELRVCVPNAFGAKLRPDLDAAKLTFKRKLTAKEQAEADALLPPNFPKRLTAETIQRINQVDRHYQLTGGMDTWTTEATR